MAVELKSALEGERGREREQTVKLLEQTASTSWRIPKRAASSDDDDHKCLHICIITSRRQFSIGPQANFSRADVPRTARRQLGSPGARPTWFPAVLALATANTTLTNISAARVAGQRTHPALHRPATCT
jgi:hypothetical protein